MEWRGWKCRFWIRKSAKIGVFAPQIFRGPARVITPTGDRLFQDIPRRVAKFHENSVQGRRKIGVYVKKKLESWQLTYQFTTWQSLVWSSFDRRKYERERPTNVGIGWKLTILYTKSHVVISHHGPCTACVVSKAMATSLSFRVSAFCRLTTQSPLHKQSPTRYLSHRASCSNFSPKIGCHGNVPYTPISV